MKRLQGVVSGVLMVSLAFAPALAHAQYVPENTPQTCGDGVDNDGNGYVDCYDPSCRMLPQCQPQQPPPPQYAPPPPQYQYQQQPPQYQQQPPPPQYYAPPPRYPQPLYMAQPQPRPPQNGVADIIVGSIFLPIGLILLGTSSVLWSDCGRGGFGCFDPGSAGYGEAWGALTMDLFGAGFVIIGAILIPIGIVKAVKYSRWKNGLAPRPQGMLDLGHGLSLTPSVTGGAGRGSAGFSLNF